MSGGKTTNVKGLRLLSEVSPRPVEWLWEAISRWAKPRIVEGDPGTNKTSMLLTTCGPADCQGGRCPAGSGEASQAQQGGMLFLAARTASRRPYAGALSAAGADLSRVGILDAVASPTTSHDPQGDPGDRAKLLVVDTLNDFLGCNVQGNQQVRGCSASDPRIWPRRPMAR